MPETEVAATATFQHDSPTLVGTTTEALETANSFIKNEFNVEIVKETVNTITLKWNLISEANVYRVEKHHRRRGWEKVAWTSKSLAIIENLEESFGYKLRVKALRFPQNNGGCYETLLVSNEIVGLTQASEPTAICLFRAIKKGQQFMVKRILRRRPTLIEYPGPNGYLPLANAIAFSSDICVVDILLSAGANIHEGNSHNNRTPLHQAFYYGRLSVARMLLNKKANMEAKDMYGLTPCHLAVDGNQGEILKFALENGANMEARDACGWTLLMRAVVLQSHLNILKILIESGADGSSRDFRNLTCQDLARIYNNDMAQEYLDIVLKLEDVSTAGLDEKKNDNDDKA